MGNMHELDALPARGGFLAEGVQEDLTTTTRGQP